MSASRRVPSQDDPTQDHGQPDESLRQHGWDDQRETGELPRRGSTANVPGSNDRSEVSQCCLNRELNRLATFNGWPEDFGNCTADVLARDGFFYVGSLDRVKCFSCGCVLQNWERSDDPGDRHRAQNPNCKMVLGTERLNAAISPTGLPLEERRRAYPCDNPAAPSMASQEERYKTYGWQPRHITATHRSLAEAGFYFMGSNLGERKSDLVKCWYCNGGLEKWEHDDEPWVEHAKWYPTCQYLLQSKGELFVQSVLSARTDRCSPLPATATAPMDLSLQNTAPEGNHQVTPETRNPVDLAIDNSTACQQILEMGFSREILRLTLGQIYDCSGLPAVGSICNDLLGLFDLVLAIESAVQQSLNNSPAMEGVVGEAGQLSGRSTPRQLPVGNDNHVGSEGQSTGISYSAETIGTFIAHTDRADVREPGHLHVNATTCHVTNEGGNNDMRAMQDQLKEMEALIRKLPRLCRICSRRHADVILFPCRHWCCCLPCIMGIRVCPVCSVQIEYHIQPRFD